MRRKIMSIVLPLVALALVAPAQAAKQSSGTQVKGTILRLKEVSLPDSSIRDKVVLLKTEDGRRIPVDLGPVDQLKEITLSIGTQLTATGSVQRIGDRAVLFARQLIVGGSTLKIQRPSEKSGMQGMPGQGMEGMHGQGIHGQGIHGDTKGHPGMHGTTGLGQKLSGRIVRQKMVRAELPSTTPRSETGEQAAGSTSESLSQRPVPHKVVLIRTSEGQNVVVDLGPASDLKRVKIRTGQRISVQARPVRIGDRLVLLADRLTAGNRTVRVAQMRPMSMEPRIEKGTPSEPVKPSTPESTPPEGTEGGRM